MTTYEQGGYILVSNLESAICIAIESEEVSMKAMGFTRDSCFVATLRQNLEYLREHGRLEVRQS